MIRVPERLFTTSTLYLRHGILPRQLKRAMTTDVHGARRPARHWISVRGDSMVEDLFHIGIL